MHLMVVVVVVLTLRTIPVSLSSTSFRLNISVLIQQFYSMVVYDAPRRDSEAPWTSMKCTINYHGVPWGTTRKIPWCSMSHLHLHAGSWNTTVFMEHCMQRHVVLLEASRERLSHENPTLTHERACFYFGLSRASFLGIIALHGVPWWCINTFQNKKQRCETKKWLHDAAWCQSPLVLVHHVCGGSHGEKTKKSSRQHTHTHADVLFGGAWTTMSHHESSPGKNVLTTTKYAWSTRHGRAWADIHIHSAGFVFALIL